MADPVCACGHRRAVAHPNSGPCYDGVMVGGKTKRCGCKKYTEAKAEK